MSDKKWADNTLQFARLIAELEAVGAITLSVMQDLCTSMDLETNQVNELIDRAQKYWEEQKEMPTLEELHKDGTSIESWACGRGNEDSETKYEWNGRFFIVHVSEGDGEEAPGASVTEVSEDYNSDSEG